MRDRTFFLSILIAVCITANLSADVTGTILGTVHDSSNLAVAGAHVAATNTEKNFVREVISGTDGGYRFLALPPGNYKVVATAPGFDQFITTGIRLQVNDELRIDVALQVGTVRETVSVEANAVQVEAESTQLGQVVNTKQILSLPLNGRSFIDLLGLQAGVAPVTAESIQQDRLSLASCRRGMFR